MKRLNCAPIMLVYGICFGYLNQTTAAEENSSLIAEVTRIPAIDARLWQNEFRTGKDDSSKAMDGLALDGYGQPASGHTPAIIAPTEGLAQMTAGPLDLLLDYSATPFDPATTMSDDSAANGRGDSLPMTNLEQATVALSNVDPFLSYTGPSLTTYLVALVAGIVVIGAVLSPKN